MDTTTQQLVIEPVHAGQLSVVLDLLSEAAAVARAKGGQIWPERFEAVAFEPHVEQGSLYGAWFDETLAGTFVLELTPTPLWRGHIGQAGYVYKLAVSPAMRGQRLGATLLTWAAAETAVRGGSALRLHCRTSNARLRTHYESLGFYLVGMSIQQPHLALYELPV